MESENRIEMVGDLDRIVKLAGETERWPEILPHYRYVRILSGGGDQKTVAMGARRGKFPVKWRATQEIDRSGDLPIIRFTHIGGVTKGMEVAWLFEPAPVGWLVRIYHEFVPPWPVIGNFAANQVIGPHFVEAIAGKTLATIKGIVEDRDPRFDPDGQERR